MAVEADMLPEIEPFISWVWMSSPQAKTWRDYRCDLALFFTIVPDRMPAEILPKDVDRFVEYQIGRCFKPATVNRRLAAVVYFYRYLVTQGLAVTCPVLPKRHYLHEPQRKYQAAVVIMGVVLTEIILALDPSGDA